MKDPVAQKATGKQEGGCRARQAGTYSHSPPDTQQRDSTETHEVASSTTKLTPELCKGQASWLGGPKKVRNLLEWRFPHLLSGGDHLSSQGSRRRCQSYISSVTLIVVLYTMFLGFKTDPNPKSACAAHPSCTPAQQNPALAPLGAKHSLPGAWRARNAGNKVTPKFLLILHPASQNCLGSCMHPLWALVFPPVKQGHVAQGHTKSCSKAHRKRRRTGKGICSVRVLGRHMIAFTPWPACCTGTPPISQIRKLRPKGVT